MRRNKPIPTPQYREIVAGWCAEERPALAVEVGVYSGKLSRLLQPHAKRLVLVDSWRAPYMHYDQKHMNAIAREVMDWALGQENVEVVRERSAAAARVFEDESIDFWHTDGDHSYEGTLSDIGAWLAKVKPGSLMSGDNYEIPTVAQAVRDALPKHQLAGKGRVWWWRKHL